MGNVTELNSPLQHLDNMALTDDIAEFLRAIFAIENSFGLLLFFHESSISDTIFSTSFALLVAISRARNSPAPSKPATYALKCFFMTTKFFTFPPSVVNVCDITIAKNQRLTLGNISDFDRPPDEFPSGRHFRHFFPRAGMNSNHDHLLLKNLRQPTFELRSAVTYASFDRDG